MLDRITVLEAAARQTPMVVSPAELRVVVINFSFGDVHGLHVQTVRTSPGQRETGYRHIRAEISITAPLLLRYFSFKLILAEYDPKR